MASAKPRRLIVTADDFGQSTSINRAVIQAHREGILTCASLMVNGDAFEEAVQLARENSRLGVGLHLTLCSGRSTLPSAEIPALVNEQRAFRDSPVGAGLKYVFSNAARQQLRSEVQAQLEKFARTGLQMDHLNGHLHFHLHPTVFSILEPELRKFRIRAVRLTDDPISVDWALGRGRWSSRLSHWLVFRWLSARAGRVLRRERIAHTDRVFGLLEDSRVSEEYILNLVGVFPEGHSELYSHPSLDNFRHEYDALVSPRVKGAIAREGIELIRYQDL